MPSDAELRNSLKEKGAMLARLSLSLSPGPSDLGSWHRHVLTSLAVTSAQQVHHISAAIAKREDLTLDLSYLAWSVRTLFELRLWTRLAIDPKHAGRFMGGLITDGLDIFAGFDGIVQQHLKEAGLAAKFGLLKNQLDAAITQIGMSKKELKFNVAEESRNMGLEDEYQQAYKFTSKLAHLTATATVFSLQQGLVEQTASVLLIWADEYLEDIIEKLKTVSSAGN